MRTRKPWRLIARIALILLVVVAATDGALTLVMERMVAAEIAKIKAKGEPVSAVELAGPAIPDNRNAAYVYARAFQVMFTPSETKDFDALGRFLRPSVRTTPVSADQARRIVARYQKAIPIVRKAVEFPQCRFPVDWENGASAQYPHLSCIRELGLLLGTDALLKARDGRMDDALDSIELGFSMSECLRDEPSIGSQLTRSAVILTMARCLRQVLPCRSITEPQARRLSDALSKIDMNPGYADAVRGNRAMMLWAFDHFRKEGIHGVVEDDELPPSPIWEIVGSKAARPILYADELQGIRVINRHIGNANLSYRELVARRLDDQDSDLPRYALLSRLALVYYAGIRMRTDRATAEITGSRIALALEVYRNRHGSYPALLGELKSLRWRLRTEDPFSGRDFIYKRRGDGYLLYSIGGNLRDDGGKEPPLGDYHYHNEGDIVWQMESPVSVGTLRAFGRRDFNRG